MKTLKNKAFTLVELLVVITILAIISVVAYQNFGGAVDKANSGRKISDVSTIETSLQQYKVDKNYYPAVDLYDSTTNMWGYNTGATATPSNKIDVNYNGEEIDAIATALGGGTVYGTGTYSSQQVGAKGTISRATLGKKYLSKDLYDPELGDLTEKSTNKKFVESGIGRYVYAVYKKPTGGTWGANNKTGTNYNLAFTIKESGTDTYITKIVGDYDSESCFSNSANCPETLIGSSTVVLLDGQKQGEDSNGSPLSSYKSTDDNQGIPYPVSDFE